MIAVRQDDGVARIFPDECRGQPEAFRQDDGHVLGAVHREVNLVVKECVLQFLDEQSLVPGFHRTAVLQTIARRRDDNDLARDSLRFE
jgi:hypothetical protein